MYLSTSAPSGMSFYLWKIHVWCCLLLEAFSGLAPSSFVFLNCIKLLIDFLLPLDYELLVDVQRFIKDVQEMFIK
jgi:hypothetical protein